MKAMRGDERPVFPSFSAYFRVFPHPAQGEGVSGLAKCEWGVVQRFSAIVVAIAPEWRMLVVSVRLLVSFKGMENPQVNLVQ